MPNKKYTNEFQKKVIEENVLHASGERMRFREMEEALLAQLRNHTNAIGRMAESRHFEKKHGKRKAD